MGQKLIGHIAQSDTGFYFLSSGKSYPVPFSARDPISMYGVFVRSDGFWGRYKDDKYVWWGYMVNGSSAFHLTQEEFLAELSGDVVQRLELTGDKIDGEDDYSVVRQIADSCGWLLQGQSRLCDLL